MDTFITPSKINGEVIAPPSKSYAHRLVLACSLFGGGVVKNVGTNKDITATVNCLKIMGANIELRGTDAYISGFNKKSNVILNCDESGSTLRFLLPVVCALGIKAKFTGSEKLLSRPNEELIKCLNKNGATVKDYKTEGKLKAGTFLIDASISSQYVTGLIIALSLLDGKSTVKLIGKSVSQPYIDITLDVLKKFNIKVEKLDGEYVVYGVGEKFLMGSKNAENSLKNDRFYYVEGDYSGASFMIGLGAIGGLVTVKGLNASSVQGDARIIDVIKKFGAKAEFLNGNLTVSNDTLCGIEIDIDSIPDLAQIIAVIACYAKGTTVIKNTKRLKYKESDRLQAICDMLSVAKITYKIDGDDLLIKGGIVHGGTFTGGNDHRTVMACAVLANYADSPSVIKGFEAVQKSYPAFFEDFKKVGGNNVVL